MRILICDDEKCYLETLRIHTEEYFSNRYIDYEIITAISPENILHGNLRFDLAFLDIQMTEIDGIALAYELKKHNSKVALFFVTNYDEYQDDAMDLRAFRFFSKPIDVSRLYSGLDKAMEYIDGAYIDLFLYGNSTQQRILVDDILYITRDGRKVVVQTIEQTFTVRQSFDEVCAQLPALFFYSVHKSYFVNLHHVKKYSYTELYLTDETRIPIAPRRQSMFHKYWFEYLRRR